MNYICVQNYLIKLYFGIVKGINFMLACTGRIAAYRNVRSYGEMSTQNQRISIPLAILNVYFNIFIKIIVKGAAVFFVTHSSRYFKMNIFLSYDILVSAFDFVRFISRE